MKKDDHKKLYRKLPKGSGRLKAATAQSIMGRGFAAETTLSLVARPIVLKKKSCRCIDGQEIYYVASNQLNITPPEFDVARLHRWGCFYHPRIVLASYEIGGDVRLYLDTRMPGYYLLWTATRCEDRVEFPGVSYDFVAWTPKQKKDSTEKAGFRLVHALLLEMLVINKEHWHCDASTAEKIAGCNKVQMIVGAIAPTVHKLGSELRRRLAMMPEYLRQLYEEGATVGQVECVYAE
jgi:hypothetical protein